MRYLLILPLLFLAACAGGIPTPQSAGLPDPDAILIPDPGALPDAQLCAYAAEVQSAADAWEAYANRWLALAGREPVSFAELAGERDEVAKVLEARRVLCVVEPPLARPAE